MGKIYIFDLDGTLVDSMPLALKIVLDFLTERDIAYPDNFVKILTPLGFKGIAKYYVEEMGVKLSPEEIYACFEKSLQKAYAEQISLKPNVKATLERLRARGDRLNVLTASPHAFTDACLKNNGVYDLFENVWSSEDFGVLKSNPKIYSMAAERLNASVAECIMTDDNLYVLETAKAAGTQTIGVYDEYSADDKEKMQRIADEYVNDFSEIA